MQLCIVFVTRQKDGKGKGKGKGAVRNAGRIGGVLISLS